MQNNSDIPIKLFNYFEYSYKQNFTFSKKLLLENATISEPEQLNLISLITPHAINDWLLLFPGESLTVPCDISDEFKNSGKYKVSVTFFRGPIVLFPTDGKPRYTEQNKWTSKEVEIEILENND